MRQHVIILGVIHIALSSIGLIAAVIVFVSVTGGGFISQDPDAMRITAIVGTSIAGVLTLLSLPGILAGIGLVKFKAWARVLALVLAVLNLFNIPIGTLLGIYSFWVLLHQDTAPLFADLPRK